jgi:hypothetical protein
MTDPVDRLAGFSGQSREALLGIWESVKANQATLDACSGHDFGALRPGTLRTRYECRHCGGWADGHAVTWYNRGVEHAKKAA